MAWAFMTDEKKNTFAYILYLLYSGMKKIVLVVFVVLILVLSNYFSGYIRLFTGEGIGKR